MQKYELLIERDVFGTLQPVEVAMDLPISSLLPGLVVQLRLPRTDLFGKQLSYQLYVANSGRRLLSQQTFAEAGVEPGMHLRLEATMLDEDSRPDLAVPTLIPTQLGAVPTIPTIPSGSTGTSARNRDPLLHSANTLGDYDALPATALAPVAYESVVPPRKQSRRAFVLAMGALLGVGGVGLSYAAYHTLLHPGQTGGHVQSKVPAQPVKQAAQPAQRPVAQQLLTFQRHQQLVRAVGWSADGQHLATTGDDAHLFVWDSRGNVLHDLPQPAASHALAWSPDGQRLVVGANTQVAFYQALDGKLLGRSHHHHTQQVTALAWSQQGLMRVVSAGMDQRAVIWDTTNYHAMLTYRNQHSALDTASWSNDGQSVATSADNGSVHVWNASSGQDLHAAFQDVQRPMRALAFAGTSAMLAVGGDDGIVRIWSGLTCTQTGMVCMDQPQRFPITKAAIRALSWSPDGRSLAVGTNDGMIVLLQPLKGTQPVLTLRPNAIVRSISWSPDGNQLATAIGNQVTLWHLQGL